MRPLALATSLLAAAAPVLALAQDGATDRAPAAAAWPLGLIVLGVAVVFLAGWLVSRRGRRHARAGRAP